MERPVPIRREPSTPATAIYFYARHHDPQSLFLRETRSLDFYVSVSDLQLLSSYPELHFFFFLMPFRPMLCSLNRQAKPSKQGRHILPLEHEFYSLCGYSSQRSGTQPTLHFNAHYPQLFYCLMPGSKKKKGPSKIIQRG